MFFSNCFVTVNILSIFKTCIQLTDAMNYWSCVISQLPSCEIVESKPTSVERLGAEPRLTTSTPNSGSSKARPRIVKPPIVDTSPNDQQLSPDVSGPKPVRGKKKSLTGRLPSSSPILMPKQQTVGSPVTSLRSPPTALSKSSPQGPRKSVTGSGPSPGGRRRSTTPEKTAINSLLSTKSEGTRRSMPASPVTPRGTSQLNNKSPRASPRFTRTPQTTPKSNSRQPASPKPSTVSRKSSSAAATTTEQSVDRPKLVKEGTFTKEPSPSVQSVTVDQSVTEVSAVREGNSNLKEKDALAETSTLSDMAAEQPSAGVIEVESLNKSNLPDALDDNSATSAPGANNYSDYIASLLLGDKALGTAKLKSSGASRSVGNLMVINSPSRTVLPRSGPTTPTVGRKSIDSQLTEIAAASKKSARNKISSLWHRDKPSKSGMDKNSTTVNDQRNSTANDSKEKCRDGLGKSPKSFRKSFPLRKSKKTAEKSEPQVEESKLTRSDTYDMIDSDQRTVEQSPGSDVVESFTADGRTQITSPASGDIPGVLHSSLDDVNETSTATGASKGFKGLSFFRRFSKDSKDKLKDDKTAELSKSEVAGQAKKKGFSLWRRDHSAGKKSKKKNVDGEWRGRSDGVVKSATLPSDVLVKASRSSESLSQLRVPSSATTDALVSATTSRRLSEVSAASPCSTELSSTFSAVDPSTKASQLDPSCLSGGSRSGNASVEIISDTEDDSPRRRRNCTSIVTTV